MTKEGHVSKDMILIGWVRIEPSPKYICWFITPDTISRAWIDSIYQFSNKHPYLWPFLGVGAQQTAPIISVASCWRIPKESSTLPGTCWRGAIFLPVESDIKIQHKKTQVLPTATNDNFTSKMVSSPLIHSNHPIMQIFSLTIDAGNRCWWASKNITGGSPRAQIYDHFGHKSMLGTNLGSLWAQHTILNHETRLNNPILPRIQSSVPQNLSCPDVPFWFTE